MKILRIAVSVLFVAAVCIFGYVKLTAKKDSTVPVISCKDDKLLISVKDSEKKLISLVTAFDVKDGDISDKVFIENMSPYISSGRTDITYVVCDSDNHVGRLTVPAYYKDYHSPHFTIKKPLVVPLRFRGFSFNDYIGVDDCIDGSVLAQNLIIVSNFDITKPGEYTVSVKATNSRFDSSSIELTAVVAEDATANPILLDKYIVYCRVGDTLDLMAYVSEEETEEVTLNEEGVDLSAPGVYEAVFSSEGKNDTRLVIVCEEGEE